MPLFDKSELRESVANLHASASSGETASLPAPTSPAADDSSDDRDAAVVTPTTVNIPETISRELNMLERSSLLGYATELEREVQEQRPFLGGTALTGEATVWYAAPNTGKTLLAIHLLIEAVELGRIEPSKLFYIAADDSANGLIEKLHILEEYGVHILAPGHQGFETARFANTLSKMTADNEVNGIFVIADTVKKFVSLMDKGEARKFGDIIRRFVMKGGTFVGLAHTNKNRDGAGKSVYSGTTDLLEDVDCAYILDEVKQDADRRVVAFRNIKRRGAVAQKVAYSYSVEEEQSFSSLLASVMTVGDQDLADLHRQSESRSDAPIVAAIEKAIAEGINSKMLLARAVSASERLGRHRVVTIIERYTGDDPAVHRWTFRTGAHGKREYVPVHLTLPGQQ